MIDKNNTVDADETLRSTLDKSVGLLGGLNKGLDVDIRFTSVEGFEYTPAMSIFDLLDVRVYHGWIVSEDDLSAYPYVSQLTYNQAVEKVADEHMSATIALIQCEYETVAIEQRLRIIPFMNEPG